MTASKTCVGCGGKEGSQREELPIPVVVCDSCWTEDPELGVAPDGAAPADPHHPGADPVQANAGSSPETPAAAWDPDEVKMRAPTNPVLPADYLLLDEAQDFAPVVAKAFNQQSNTQKVAVGDSCQPLGTLVSVVTQPARNGRWSQRLLSEVEQIPIEELKVEDRVIAYGVASRHIYLNGKPISGITERPYSGQLVRITTSSGLTSRYTTDHHSVARFGEGLVDKHVVYLMRRGSDYRIGVTGARIFSQAKRLGLIQRAMQEEADAAWILSVHDSRRAALIEEATTTWTSSIPDLIFKAGNNSTLIQEDLDLIWSKVGSNRDKAIPLLASYGRDVNFPLWTKGERLQTRRPFVTRACNLIEGMEVLPFGEHMRGDRKGVKRDSWEAFTIAREVYEGPVYSVTVDDAHTYVGDGIFTHNCQATYGWRGARDAMAGMRARRPPPAPDQSFRFSPAIADEANKWLGLLPAKLRLTGTPTIASKLHPIGRRHELGPARDPDPQHADRPEPGRGP